VSMLVSQMVAESTRLLSLPLSANRRSMLASVCWVWV
jgi:hypothetical protein